jgi:hypothetical protein
MERNVTILLFVNQRSIKMYTHSLLLFVVVFLIMWSTTCMAGSCLDDCLKVDKSFEATCQHYGRQTNEYCHGQRTLYHNRCSIQCTAIEETLLLGSPTFSPARAACRVQCSTVVNQIYATNCQVYPLEERMTCYDLMFAFSAICSAHCDAL